MFLPDGTKGWYVSGESLVEGVSQATTDRSETAKAWSAQAPKQSSERFAARHIMPAELDAWRAESESRTLYIFDIRTREEYDDGHLADSIWIPGGQLVGFTQDYLATRNARICLVDNDCSRAELVAGWMLQIGWPEVVVLDGGIGDQGLVTGTTPLGVPELEKVQVPTISPTALAGRIQACTAVVIDFARSAQHTGGHIPGAWWMNRSSLPRLVGRLPTAQTYVATSSSGEAGLLAAAELANLVDTPVMVLEGGTAAWQDAGLEVSTGLPRPIGELDDTYTDFAERPGDDTATRMAACRRTAAWRGRLRTQYRNDSTLPFKT
jgi:rhodanese-related sulfurtransferase